MRPDVHFFSMTLFGASVKSVKYADKKGVENQVLHSLLPLLLYSQDENDAVAEVMCSINCFLGFASNPEPDLQINVHIFESRDFCGAIIFPQFFLVHATF